MSMIPQLIFIVLQSLSLGIHAGELAMATKEQLQLKQKAFRNTLFPMVIINVLLAFGGFLDVFFR